VKNRLIAAAVAAGIAMPLAANADVNIYGKMHVSISSYDTGATGATVNSDGMSISSSASRIGFKGSEDLGNGLKTIWQIEQQVDVDEGGKDWASRNTYLGLKGDWGSVIAGYHDTPFKKALGKFNPWGDTYADIRAVIGEDGGLGADHYNQRAKNILQYTSPKFSGLQVKGAYSADMKDSGDPDDNDGDISSVSATYTSGGLYLVGAYEEHEDLDDTHGIRLGSTLAMSATKVGFMWESFSGDAAAGMDHDAWTFLLSQGIGSSTFKLQYTTRDQDSDVVSNGADMWSIGLDHKLSKRTKAYVYYAALESEDDGEYTFGKNTDGIKDTNGGQDPHALSVGLVHKF